MQTECLEGAAAGEGGHWCFTHVRTTASGVVTGRQVFIEKHVRVGLLAFRTDLNEDIDSELQQRWVRTSKDARVAV